MTASNPSTGTPYRLGVCAGRAAAHTSSRYGMDFGLRRAWAWAGVRDGLARATAILLALLAAGANAQARGVFVGAASEGVVAERSAERGQLGQQANHEALQQRTARLDFERLAAVREAVEQGQPARARLNLFEDAEFDWIVERTVPTGTGYSLSGPWPAWSRARRRWWRTAAWSSAQRGRRRRPTASAPSAARRSWSVPVRRHPPCAQELHMLLRHPRSLQITR